MAVHRQPEQAGADLGPRWRTLVPLETPFPDVDPGEALRRAHRYAEQGWRTEALESLQQWQSEFSKVVADHIQAQYAARERQFLASWEARFETGDAREADQFQAWLEHAIREGTVEAQLAVIDALEAPEWLKRYASYVRRYRERTQAFDTGTIFYDPARRWR
jgi:hypothetical protein